MVDNIKNLPKTQSIFVARPGINLLFGKVQFTAAGVITASQLNPNVYFSRQTTGVYNITGPTGTRIFLVGLNPEFAATNSTVGEWAWQGVSAPSGTINVIYRSAGSAAAASDPETGSWLNFTYIIHGEADGTA